MGEGSNYQVLDGRACAEAVKQRIAQEALAVKAARGHAPHLAAVLVGDDGASRTYVEAKVKACTSIRTGTQAMQASHWGR